MTTAGRAGRFGLASLVAVALATAGCSGGDPRSSRTTAESTIALGTLATGPAATATPGSDPTSGAAIVQSGEGSDRSSFVPAALLAGGGTRPWLLAGTSRDRPGQPARLAVLTSPDGATWTTLDVDGPAGSQAAAAAVGPDGAAVIAGTVDGDDGPQPALWTLDGDSLGEPETLALDGVVRAMALDDAGSPVLLIDGPDGPTVATDAGASWTATVLAAAVDPAGVAVRGDAVVVTGSTTWRSTDGGATFAPVPTSPLGPVVASGGGFAAADCTTGGVAVSGDGSTWTSLVEVHPRGEVPVPGECATIAVDDEGGVWLAATVAGEPVVYRALDGVVDRLGVPARPPGTIFAGPRLVAAAGGTVVSALGQPGGVAVSSASAVGLTTGLELDAAMTATTGAPPGHPVPVAVVPFDDRGAVAGVLTSPYVVDDPDGSYRWSTRAAAARVDGAGRIVLDERAAPIGADGNLGGIVTTPNGAVALATVPDPSPAPDAGSIGDVVVSRRTGNGWSARATVLEGAGRQAVNAVVAVGATVVGVGEQSSADATTGREELVPLVLVGDGTTFEPVPVEGAGAASLTVACRAPDGTVLAFGRDSAAGTNIAVDVDPVARRASVRPGPPGSAPVGCASTHDVIFLASAGTVMSTVDAERYEPLDVLRPGEAVTALAVGPGAIAVTGTTSLGDGFVLLLGPTGRAIRLDAPIIGGPGDHLPTGVVVSADDVVVLGLGDGAPTAWRVAR